MANEFKVRKGLSVNGSGSVILDVQGSQGQLFSVTDVLSGSLFAVKDISGMPIIEAFSDDRVNIGAFNREAIKVSGSVASVTGSFTGSFTGSLLGTASQALTASYALGGSASSILFQTASAATTWSFNHFLQTQYPVFTIYDEGNNVIVPQQITAVDTSSALIYFSSPKRGVAVASKGGYSASVVTSATTANTAISASFASSGTGTFSGSFSGSYQGNFSGSYFGTASQALSASYALNSTNAINSNTASSVLPLSQSLFVTGALNLTGSLRVTGSILQNGGALAPQDGTILYHNIVWFTPTSTVSTSGTTVTSVGTQFTSFMVGAKLTISGESRIISAFTSTTQVTVDSAYSQNYSGIAAGSWGVFSKSLTMAAADNPNLSGGFEIRNSTNGSLITAIYDRIQIGLRLADGGNNVAFNTTGVAQAFQMANDKTLVWYSGSSASNNALNTSADTGLRKNTAGVLEIYDGVTADGAVANRRDLILRNITGSNAFFSSSLVVSGSASVTGSLNVSGSITTSGTITAQTLVVQTVTSSIVFSSGSNIFGNAITNTQTMTGSLNVTGSATIVGSVQSTRFYNIFAGQNSNNSRNSFQSFQIDEATGVSVGWIAADFGDRGTTSARVVMGSGYGNKAILGAHNGALTAWGDLYINPGGGNVLIGTTTTAGFRLDVSGSTRVQGNIELTTTGVQAYYYPQYTDVYGSSYSFNTHGAFNISFNAQDTGIINFITSGSEKARLFNTGNFTIQNGGTFTDAGFRLDVSGSTRITNNLTVSGSTQITGSLGITGSISTSANATIGGTLSATGIQNIRQYNTDTSFLGGSISIGKQSIATAGYVLDVSGSALISGSVVMSGSYTQNGFKILTAVSQSLNFANDASAAAGGVPLGGLYRSGNFILIRLS